jgi:Putative restriction endonuclease
MATAAPQLFDLQVEASYDPFEENMGEGSLQRFISEALRPELERLFTARGEPAFVGADQYVGLDPHDPRSVVAPDVYVLPGVVPGEDFDFWRVWQTGIVPSFALEIVSSRKGKDYVDAPQRYAALGVRELVILDPRYKRRRGVGFQWQVYRLHAKRGFVRVDATNEDRVRSSVLGCWLRAVGTGKNLRLRLAADPAGEALVPTAAEAAQTALVAERTARMEAEAEITRLRAQLGIGFVGGRGLVPLAALARKDTRSRPRALSRAPAKKRR